MKKILSIIATAMALGVMAPCGSAGDFTAKVSWSHPTNEAPLGFRIYLAIGALPYTDPTTKVFSVTNGAARSHNIQVDPGTSYRCAVTAFNEWQETEKSAPATFSTPALLSVPADSKVAVIVYVP